MCMIYIGTAGRCSTHNCSMFYEIFHLQRTVRVKRIFVVYLPHAFFSFCLLNRWQLSFEYFSHHREPENGGFCPSRAVKRNFNLPWKIYWILIQAIAACMEFYPPICSYPHPEKSIDFSPLHLPYVPTLRLPHTLQNESWCCDKLMEKRSLRFNTLSSILQHVLSHG